MQEGMLHRIQFPGKYLQGVNALAELPKLIAQYGSRGLVLTSPSAKRILTGAGALPELAELPIVGFGGECCEKEIASLSAAIAVHHADVLVGMGGGKAIDTAKIAADRAGIPVIVVPTIASTIPFEPHPARDSILGEAHARPFFRLEAPARVLALAFVRGKDSPEVLRERLDNFARAHGAAPGPAGAKHHRMMLPQGLFRWEEHTEFTTYVFMLSGEAARFNITAGEVLRSVR